VPEIEDSVLDGARRSPLARRRGTIIAGPTSHARRFSRQLPAGSTTPPPITAEVWRIKPRRIAISRLARQDHHKSYVVDTDVPTATAQPNIFRNDDSVFTLSIHQKHNYPRQAALKSGLNLDAGRRPRTLAVLLPSFEKQKKKKKKKKKKRKKNTKKNRLTNSAPTYSLRRRRDPSCDRCKCAACATNSA